MSAEVVVIGPEQGRPVLYFHSPATAGDELEGARSTATRLNIRLISLRRPSVACDDPARFLAAVAEAAEEVISELGLGDLDVLAWSGGAPYALAVAARLGPVISAVHLVSPVPGPLTGPGALADQSNRLRQIARSTESSSWISSPSMLRDYEAIAAPWPFDFASISQDVTIWSPTEDEIVPARLLLSMAAAMPSATVVEVQGNHAWLTENWALVLQHAQV